MATVVVITMKKVIDFKGLSSKKTVAIIGAGPGGLVAAKEAIQHGLLPVVFEKSDDVGGVWRDGTWNSMRTNLSRFSCCFSDYMMIGSDHFVSHKKVHGYLRNYANTFGVTEHIRFGHEVIDVSQDSDGAWIVKTKTEKGEQSRKFNFVIAASGIFDKGFIPFPEEDRANFKGQILHSKDYKTPDEFAGKKVVVIGSAFSGNEISAELAEAGVNVTQMVRTPTIVIPRSIDDGKRGKQPVDFAFYKYCSIPTADETPYAEKQSQRTQFLLNKFGNPGNYHPDLNFDQTQNSQMHLTISDTYPDHVRSGAIQIARAGAVSLREKGVLMCNQKVLNADAIICSTGYKLHLPYFGEKILDKLEYSADDSVQPLVLHKSTFSPHMANIGFLGLYKAPYFGTLELQARWIVRVFAGVQDAPSREEMEIGQLEERLVRSQTPRPQFAKDNYVKFAIDLAKQIGAMPSQDTLTAAGFTPDMPIIPAIFRLNNIDKDINASRASYAEAMQKRAVESINSLRKAMFAQTETEMVNNLYKAFR